MTKIIQSFKIEHMLARDRVKIRVAFLVICLTALSLCFLLSENTLGAYKNMTVEFTVPESEGGGGGGGTAPPTDDYPVISGVSTTSTYDTATIFFTATDDNPLTDIYFNYGLTGSYGYSATPVSLGSDNYQVDLTGLNSNTVYYFIITAVDSSLQSTNQTGSFVTQIYIPPVDTTPPFLSNIQVVPDIISAIVSWETNEPADGLMEYGLSDAYGYSLSDSSLLLSHGFILNGLLPNTLYHYKLTSADGEGNASSTSDLTFTTLKDSFPPPDVSDLHVSTTSDDIVLNWVNPNLVSTPDFVGVVIMRKIGSAPTSVSDGILVYTGSGSSFVDSGVAKDVAFYYTVFSYDTSGNYSNGVSGSGMVITPTPPEEPPEEPEEPEEPPEEPEIPPEEPETPPEEPETPPEEPEGPPETPEGPPTGETYAACGDSVDNDGDGLIDYPADPGCASISDNSEYDAEEPTVPVFARLSLADLEFAVGHGQLPILPVHGVLSGLAGFDLMVLAPAEKMTSRPESIVFRVGDGDLHNMVLSADGKNYFAVLSFPVSGSKQAYLEIDYGFDQKDAVGVILRSIPLQAIVGNDNEGLDGARVVLLSRSGQRIDLSPYGESNPYITGEGGYYGWAVPDGVYRLEVSKPGYYSRSTRNFEIFNHFISRRVKLLIKPPELFDVIDPEAPWRENAINILKNLGERGGALSTIAAEWSLEAADDPQVERAVEVVVAPSAAGVVALGILPFISFNSLLSFLQLMFLQPAMLFGWTKRKEWGYVYNSLNKVPVDLALVRLIDVKTGKIIRSKVTDDKGRYIFISDPGEYKIEVRKDGFVFPSELLKDSKIDGKFTDIYHGGSFKVNEKGAAILFNIPLDPVGAAKKPGRLFWGKVGRRFQTSLSLSGIAITATSLYISPKWYIGALLCVHIFTFIVFRRVTAIQKAKHWGVVFDDTTKKPINKAVARLFNAKFNRLVSAQVTDARGRYSFLAGGDRYYATYEREGYEPARVDIDLTKEAEGTVAVNIPLRRKGGEKGKKKRHGA